MRFGPGGASPLFYAQGGKSSLEVPRWLAGLGLQAFEYQCNRGVNIKEATATALGLEAARHGISLTVHGPYYINLAAQGPTRANTKRHILRSMEAAVWMGASKVVIHPGSGNPDRPTAMARARELLQEALHEARELGLTGVKLAPETTGKRNMLGSMKEIIALCQVSGEVVPAIDFGHLYARSGGNLKTAGQFRAILESVVESLGPAALSDLHIHFSPIEFTAGGEKRHRNLTEEGFGPEFVPLAEALCQLGVSGTIICESYDRQVADALVFREMWGRICEE